MHNLAQKQTPTPRHEEHLAPNTVAGALAAQLSMLGIEQAFGVSGGGIAMVFDALADSPIELCHFRHETGAAFAAVEAHFATNRPVVLFTTTGPGLLNALNGLAAAKWDGAKVILLSGSTSTAQRGRWATQETSSYTLPQDFLYGHGPLFDYAVRVEHANELAEVMRRLEQGLLRPGGFVAHVSLPMAVASSRVEPRRQMRSVAMAPTLSFEQAGEYARLLQEDDFAIWIGFGARKAWKLVRELVERSGAACFCSPRGKGIVSENHPRFLGVTGLGGHEAVVDHMVQRKPRWLLVLGTKLGEATSFWDCDLLPSEGLLHVDLDTNVPGTAFPHALTIGVQAEIGQFLEALLEHFPVTSANVNDNVLPLPTRRFEAVAQRLENRAQHPGRPVRPQVLMEVMQRQIVQGSDALVLAECGNSFAWCNHYLRFTTPERYRVSPHWGSMGHCAAGVVGAALGRRGKAVAVVGDGSMLMNSEVSTAVQYNAGAVWLVLNDAGYGMCRMGHEALGLATEEIDIPRVDFVAMARAMGADGVMVESEDQLDAALARAMSSSLPFVVDIHIDPDEASPLLQRFESLIRQGTGKNVAGWEQ